MPHGHSHNNGHCCGHNEPQEIGIKYSLYQKIDLNNVECLNEVSEGSGKKVFKPYESRLDTIESVTSDSDEELLFNIPFMGNVKLKGIIIIGSNDDSHPNKMRLFKNRPKMTFDDIVSKADQEFQLSRDNRGEIEYHPKLVTFSSINHLSIHFPSNFGSDYTRIYYIGLCGEFTVAREHGVTICNYEARPNIADHTDSISNSATHIIH